ncbi:SusC/RagA family TonB-linked outer membrane protein [Pedobacter aquatilis]|uniref:SusC/RagA family TonB-linked outer membrane protein n=1 Tax=Pedobacter aquatilis TaxID=351343 RepID=UPI0025B423A5|nr:SusC/RagA family TonB-linked outer membrane protein [Pedobacter aquatilis]MDN3588056.1 SusC/RagA family TonB-linked outer membrane protein [Pedobacter aquatilis]
MIFYQLREHHVQNPGEVPTGKTFDHICWRYLITTFIKCYLTVTLILLFVGLSASNSKAQTITLKENNTALRTVMDKIERQSGYDFWYTKGAINESEKISIDVKGESLNNVVKRLTDSRNLTFEILDKTIFLKLRAGEKTPANAIPPTARNISGIVVDEQGKPLADVTIGNTTGSGGTSTDKTGKFNLLISAVSAKLNISSVGYNTKEIVLSAGQDEVLITLQIAQTRLEDVQIVSTGYQSIPKERATGSFEQINNAELSRRPSSNILDKLENMAAGFLTNRNERGKDNLSIRGRSTIFSDATPLIILNNFPYEGNIADINPNDIESVTILKDAAAASIWGSRAGNGVIVLTTKRGRTGQPRINLSSTITFMQRPLVEELKRINSRDFLEFEQKLFDLGYFRANESLLTSGISFPAFTPFIESLRQARDGGITAEELNRRIEGFKGTDGAQALKQNFYRNSNIQRHAVNISGAGERSHYYLSAGLDKEVSSFVGQGNKRLSLRAQNSIELSKSVKAEFALNFINSKSEAGNNSGINLAVGGRQLYPYAKLVDENGKALAVDLNYNRVLLEQSSRLGFLNWEYSPLGEIYRRIYKSDNQELLANAGMDYQMIDGLSFSVKYQFRKAINTVENDNTASSYYTRNLINNFTQIITPTSLSRPVPIGDILTKTLTKINSHQARAQLSYSKSFSGVHEVNAIAGWEIRSLESLTNNGIMYGYFPNGGVVSSAIDFVTQWPQYSAGSRAGVTRASIPSGQSLSGITDRYWSYFTNASYSFKKRFTLSGSLRTDASNLFGVKANQKEVPLYSLGFSWKVDNESFYNSEFLPTLVLRTTYGTQGNVSKKASAYTTGNYVGNARNTGLPYMEISTPPNESLKWETLRQLNFGLDFGIKNDILAGSLEFYTKNGVNLLGQAPLDPTTGMGIGDSPPFYFGNVASIKGSGVDIRLSSSPLKGTVRWDVNLLYSYAKSRISDYLIRSSNFGNAYLSDFLINPSLGEPVYAIYAYPWGGLDAATGNPQGYLNGRLSSDYNRIISETFLQDMKSYNSAPTSFGSIRNTYGYKNFSLSFNISFQLGFYFRNPSVNYGVMATTWNGHSDYAKRWQKPGDERNTHVPSFSFPLNANRDQFYTYSSVLIERGDNIRFEDIALSYSLNKNQHKKLPFSNLTCSAYLNNLGLLWRANNQGLDPVSIYTPRNPANLTLGINLTF